MGHQPQSLYGLIENRPPAHQFEPFPSEKYVYSWVGSHGFPDMLNQNHPIDSYVGLLLQ